MDESKKKIRIIVLAAAALMIIGTVIVWKLYPEKKPDVADTPIASMPIASIMAATPAPTTAAGTTQEVAEAPTTAKHKHPKKSTTAAVTETTTAETESSSEACEFCHDTGWVSCPTCQGKGILTQSCVFCAGTGQTDHCYTCDGTGRVHDPGTKCSFCVDGQIYVPPTEDETGYYEVCPYCEGSGIERAEGEYPCKDCEGTGHLKEMVKCPECGGIGVTVIDTCPDCFEDENGVHTGMIPCTACEAYAGHPEPPTLTIEKYEEMKLEEETKVESGEGQISKEDGSEEETSGEAGSAEAGSGTGSSESSETGAESGSETESQTESKPDSGTNSHSGTNVSPGA